MSFSLLIGSDAAAVLASLQSGDLADVDVTAGPTITQDFGSYVDAPSEEE